MNPSTHSAGPVDNSHSPQSLLRTLPRNGAQITGGFWATHQATNRNVSLPHGYAMLEAAGNLQNMRIAAGLAEGTFAGFWFADSDLYKWLEAAAWELGRTPDAQLQAQVDTLLGLIAAAQLPDGYINSHFQIARPAARWTDLDHGHELYCAGHLVQAAVAFQRAVNDDRLMQIALRFVDHIYDLFGPGKRDETCGHPEIETALVELYRVTSDARHLEMAQLFIDRRGRNRMRGHAGYGAIYQQDHVPVRAATEVAGHAVRQIYLTTGVTDLYMETGERALMDAMVTLWNDMTQTKMYITGGLGSRFDGEAFGSPYELPSDTCYCETCAAIASIMWSWRMLLVTGERRYADLIERTLYNGVLPSPGLEGASYLYVNPLQVRGGRYVRSGPDGAGAEEIKRPAWHSCACCPPNVMRLFSSLQDYLVTTSGNAIQVHQYADASANVALPAGAVALEMTTNYPWEGAIAIQVLVAPAAPWTLALRIPAWAQTHTVRVNDQPVEGTLDAQGYLSLARTWHAGDVVAIDLPMEPTWIVPNPRVDAIRGTVALERGPLVYCFESHDQPAAVDMADVQMQTAAPITEAAMTELGGGVKLHTTGSMPGSTWRDGLYRTQAADTQAGDAQSVPLTAIPYYAWGNRGMRGMRVWLPTAPRP